MKNRPTISLSMTLNTESDDDDSAISEVYDDEDRIGPH